MRDAYRYDDACVVSSVAWIRVLVIPGFRSSTFSLLKGHHAIALNVLTYQFKPLVVPCFERLVCGMSL